MADRERRVAVAEKARAERHFASVRKLANTFMFDVHGEIEDLPGSLKARRDAREHLARVPRHAREGGAERSRAHARARGRLPQDRAHPGRQAASPTSASRRPRAGTPRNRRSLLAGLEARVAARHPGAQGAKGDGATPRTPAQGRRDPSAMAAYEEAVRISERIAGLPGATAEDRRSVAIALAEYAISLAVIRSDYAAAVAPITRATEFWNPCTAPTPAISRRRPGSPEPTSAHRSSSSSAGATSTCRAPSSCCASPSP